MRDRHDYSVRRLSDCHKIADFRELARRRLPYPVFNYIDGAADDEATKDRNTAAFDQVDLVPDVLVGADAVACRDGEMGVSLPVPGVSVDEEHPATSSPTAQKAAKTTVPRIRPG